MYTEEEYALSVINVRPETKVIKFMSLVRQFF